MMKTLTMLSTLSVSGVSAPLSATYKVDQNDYNTKKDLEQLDNKSLAKKCEKTDRDKIETVKEALEKIKDIEIECTSAYVNGDYCAMVWDIKYAIKKLIKHSIEIKEVELHEDLNLELKSKTRNPLSIQDSNELTIYDRVLFDDVIIVKGTIKLKNEEENFKFSVKVKSILAGKIGKLDK